MVYGHLSLVLLAISLGVKHISGQCTDGPLDLFGFWELSGRRNPNDSDVPSCNVKPEVTFPSFVDDNEAQVIGQVTYVSAPDVVDHRCAVLSDVDSALDFGNYSGECVSSPDLCPCGLTVTLWIKPFDLYPNATSNWYYLSTGGQTLYAHGIAFYRLVSDQSFRIKLRTSKLSYEVAIADSDVPDKCWSHFAMVYTQATGIKVYTNGTLVATSAKSQREVKSDTKTNLVVGGSNSLSKFSKAAFSDLRIYTNALTDSQISSLAFCNSINDSLELTAVRQLDLPLDSALTFQCRTRGYPSPTIEWEYHDGHRVTKLDQNSSAVEVTRVNISNCIDESTLRVNSSYVVSNEFQSIICRVGSSGGKINKSLPIKQQSFDGTVNVWTRGDITLDVTVHVMCSVSGDEIHTVDWYRRRSFVNHQNTTDELIVPSEGGRHTTSQLMTSSTRGEFTLDILAFQEKDYGVYICSVNRGLGVGLIHLLKEAKQPTTEPLSTQKIQDGDYMVGTTAWTTKPMTSDAVDHVDAGTVEMIVSEVDHIQDGDSMVGTTAWILKQMTSDADDHVDVETVKMIVSEVDQIQNGDSEIGTRTPKPMTSDAVDHVDVGTVEMIASEAVQSQSTLHETTPGKKPVRKKTFLTYGNRDKRSKFIVKKSRLSWMVPVAICIIGVGFPGVIVCYFINRKREVHIDPLEKLLMSKKKIILIPKTKRPAVPAKANTPKTVLAQPRPAFPAVRMIKVRSIEEQDN